jgi:hypothetical protein
MLNLKFLDFKRHTCWFVILILFVLQLGHDGAATSPHAVSVPAYVRRGLEVDQHFAAYSNRLARYYESLSRELKQRAPDFLVHLQPPTVIRHGYQILPAISPDADPKTAASAGPVAYSWPWTDRLIDIQLRDIARSEAELRRALRADSSISRTALEQLALNYRAQSRSRQNIDAHIQYNHLWQAAIAADRAGYDQATALESQVIERRKIADQLNHLGVKMGVRVASSTNSATGLRELTMRLQAREALLSQQINQVFSRVNTPGFVQLETTNEEWIIHVPLFTDIADEEFVNKVKHIVETTWRLTERAKTFRVELNVAYLPAFTLYGEGNSPSPGQQIDVRRHLQRFPSDGAILTTGALTTHVQGHAIILGPHTISAKVLAHEFGHILGFRDRYIRVYNKLGENGFQVTEVIADPEDIMSATSQGLVLPAHFTSLVRRGAITRILPAAKPVNAQVKRTKA